MRPSLKTPESAGAEYEVKNRLGLIVFTSPEISLARRFARLNADRLGPLYVEEVQIIEHRRRIWTARPKLALVGGAS